MSKRPKKEGLVRTPGGASCRIDQKGNGLSVSGEGHHVQKAKGGRASSYLGRATMYNRPKGAGPVRTLEGPPCPKGQRGQGLFVPGEGHHAQ
jgi:hypothetical protein